MDVDSIPLGVNFNKVLVEEVAKCDVLLAVIGPDWLDARDEKGHRRLDNPDDFVRIEIGTALKRGIPVIPILLQGTRVPKADQLPNDLKELALRNGLDVRHASFSEDMERLIRGLKGAPSSRQPASAASSLADSGSAPSHWHSHFWKFLRKDKNWAVLGWIGGGIVVVISALWALFARDFRCQRVLAEPWGCRTRSVARSPAREGPLLGSDFDNQQGQGLRMFRELLLRTVYRDFESLFYRQTSRHELEHS